MSIQFLIDIVMFNLILFFIRQMISHYANMYPQLIKDPKVLGPVERFMV